MNYLDSETSENSDNDVQNLLEVAMLTGIDFKSICPRIVNKPKQRIPKSNYWTDVYPNLI